MADTALRGVAVQWGPVVLAVTLVQAVLAAASRTLPVLGMPLTQAAGMSPEAVGQFSSASSLGSMLFFLWGPTLLRHLTPVQQLRAGCAVVGVSLVLCLSEQWHLLLLASLVIGIGYGPGTTAGSELLMRVVPRRRRATIFSIKQAGVPLGGAVAGLLLPLIALGAGGVGAALVCVAGVAFFAAIALGLWKGQVDDDPGEPHAALHSLMFAPIRVVGTLFRTSRLRWITLAGFALGASQSVVMGFFPVFLSDHAGYSLAAAGAAFALLQGTGIAGRVAMGWLSDRLGDPMRALGGLCLLSGATMVLLATIGPGSAAWWVGALSILAGLGTVSWNGVLLTGLAEAAPEGRVGAVTAAGTFVLFSGYVFFPLVFQFIFERTEGYATGLILAGCVPAVAGVVIVLKPNQGHPGAP